MKWLPFLPDLNPIKYAWAKLKELIYKLDLKLAAMRVIVRKLGLLL
jgi:transposase